MKGEEQVFPAASLQA
jgi:hypothetical protein